MADPELIRLLPSLRGVPIVLAEVSGVELTLMIDTGAPMSVLTPSAVERLGLTTDGVRHSVSTGGAFEAPWVSIPERDLGGVVLPADRGIVLAKDGSERVHGVALDGIIGVSALRGRRFVFDPPSGRMWTEPSETEPTGLGEPLAFQPHLVDGEPVHFIEARLDGMERVHATVDTGASRCVINEVALAGLDPGAPRETIRLKGSGPALVEAVRVRARELGVGGQVIRDPLLAVADAVFEPAPHLLDRPAMLLGSDILKDFTYALDFHRRAFWLAGA